MPMLHFRFALLALLLSTPLAPLTVQAETRGKPSKAAAANLQVSLLGGKLAFTLPAGYVKDEMPEVDAKARAEGVSGAMYTHPAEKRVLIVTETPIPVGVEASDNDAQVLDELSAAALTQQGSSYQNVQRLGEQRLLKKNGLGVRQLDASATLGGANVLSTTLLAASGSRSAVLNVISSARDPKAHEAAVKAIIGR
ncbi:polyribonucleotide nucleotidyltransferase [Pseudomonas syringae]|nr:polyribonucleotide nucleotidyltransferase [Pseudomonas syringae]MBD8574703.1 polyribonucleotide nucleotidyltransferase [Pseudomonas syringae]MBD8789266.1 polyribonucleotide nucleotidyltransferase [Pseudomonas syringae]MBD8800290.1 polyribonucleotide nucleotidyltransferase [Pseudomonas syringae]MBD8810694.1 polyribonucleotide nucleotidyltransferase [Pseudomonas syringae]